MENLLLGIPVFLLCATGFYFAWRAAKAENFQLSILLIVLCGLLLRIYAGTDFFLHEWDERYHALVAKNQLDSNVVVFNVPMPIEFMFYTDATAYPFVPPEKELDSLSLSGYRLFIYEAEALKKIGN